MSLTLRLLSACRQTYAIAGAGPVAPVSAVGPVPATAGAGWTVSPVGVVAGDEGQHAALVGVMAEGIVVAIRGTTPPVAGADLSRLCADWLDDFIAELVVADGFPGRVHDGFRGAVGRLWPGVKALVDAQDPDRPLIVTGHSKGGACSGLMAWLLHQAYPGRRILVRSFAGARVADVAFASAYNAAIQDHIRYEYGADIVPHLPVCGALAEAVADCLPLGRLIAPEVDYGSVGSLAYIETTGAIHGDSAMLEAERIAALAVTLCQPDGLEALGACHSIDDASAGYVRAAYPP